LNSDVTLDLDDWESGGVRELLKVSDDTVAGDDVLNTLFINELLVLEFLFIDECSYLFFLNRRK
jgi:hypothetical protein